MFFDVSECHIASYADDNTPYTNGFSLDTVTKKSELRNNKLFEWFRKNHMTAHR